MYVFRAKGDQTMTDSRRPSPGRALAVAVFFGLVFGSDPLRGSDPHSAPSIDGAWYRPTSTFAAAPARLSDLALAADRLTTAEKHELPPLSEDERLELSRV